MTRTTTTSKRKPLIAVIAGWLTLGLGSPGGAQAADTAAAPAAQATGTISGRAQNVVTARYLHRARITVQGTNLIAFTDELGVYRLVGVPAGPVVLQVFYTDLDPQEVTLNLQPGQNLEHDFSLTSGARYGQAGALVKLDPFLVALNKETDAEAIATNEQRFASNIKNVIATDSLGDLVGASAGDFLKFMPGIAAEYDNAEVLNISIRGIGGDMSGVEIDGAPAASAVHGGPGRAVNLIPQSIDNLSRIEITKVPTPATSAASLAGSVNMISKSSFERRTALLSFGLNLTGNFNEFTLNRTPHPYKDARTNKIIPGYDFSYTVPVNDRFGFVLTAMSNSTFNSQNLTTPTWNPALAGTTVSPSSPYLQQYAINVAPRHRSRTFYGAKIDWRVTPNSVLTVGGRVTRTVSAKTGFTSMTANAGTVATSTPAGGAAFDYGPTFTAGAFGRGAVSLGGNRQYGTIDADQLDATYRFDNGRWKIGASFNWGESRAWLNPDGIFSSSAAALINPVRVTLADIRDGVPNQVEAFNASGQRVDLYDINNYRMTTASRAGRMNLAVSRYGKVDIGRRLELFSFPFTLQGGGAYHDQIRDRRWDSLTMNFAGTTHSPVPYLTQVYTNPVSELGSIPRLSAQRVHDAGLSNPAIFAPTPAQLVAEHTYAVTNSEYAREGVKAFYLQGEARLFQGRLTVLTGVRYERTDTEGEGLLYDPNLVWLRNASGAFVRDNAGNRIRRTEAGAVGSMEEARLVRTERGYKAERTYDGFYPSLHFTYNIRENFLARLAYASTFGRPDFPNIIPNTTINQANLDEDDIGDPQVVQGTLTVRNTALKPWSAHNYDLSVEYYTDQGGVFTAGAFYKDISDFFGSQPAHPATQAELEALGLDSRYVGWNLATQFNSGDASIKGVEFSARHSLRPLGEWGKHFTVFANGTRLWLNGNPHGSFQSFIPKTANWGVTVNWKRWTIMPKWNYRGLDKRAALPVAWGNDAFTYIDERIIMDLSVLYKLSSRFSLSASVGNVFNDNLTQLRYGSQTPKYSYQYLNGEYGTSFSLGIKGSF